MFVVAAWLLWLDNPSFIIRHAGSLCEYVRVPVSPGAGGKKRRPPAPREMLAAWDPMDGDHGGDHGASWMSISGPPIQAPSCGRGPVPVARASHSSVVLRKSQRTSRWDLLPPLSAQVDKTRTSETITSGHWDAAPGPTVVGLSDRPAVSACHQTMICLRVRFRADRHTPRPCVRSQRRNLNAGVKKKRCVYIFLRKSVGTGSSRAVCRAVACAQAGLSTEGLERH